MAERAAPASSSIPALAGQTLAACARAANPSLSWSDARKLCASGKISVDDAVVLDPATRLRGDEVIVLSMNARAPRPPAPRGFRVVFEDAHIIVIEKPEGITSVPYERKDTGTALDLIRAHWRTQNRRATATPLYTVHRLDKDTSGLLSFAKSRLGERGLHRVFQQHLADREYIAVVEGRCAGGRIESRLVADRGDGLRGSTRVAGQGQRAITHVEVMEALPATTVCRVRLETGRTHQIRIHLSERGHPLVGETVYVRDLRRAGIEPMPAARLLLHAATLGFEHPVTQEPLRFTCDPPPEFLAEVDRLRRARGDSSR